MRFLPRALVLVGLALVGSLRADMIAPPPASQRAAQAQFVVVGKVIKVADRSVPAEMFKGDERRMMVATVKVQESLLGRPGKEIKVGTFITAPIAKDARPREIVNINLVLDQEAMLFLQPHPTLKDTFVLPNYFDLVTKKDNPAFAAEREQVRKAATILKAPLASLRAKNAEDRFLAAALLISRYRTPVPGNDSKTEPVPAAETKLLLEALAEADWKAERGPLGFYLAPRGLFFRLGLTPADGWKQPDDFNQIEPEAKKWLKANAEKFKLQRFVRPPLNSKDDPEP
jgi:hypothetical protein